jgi:hypothetical protein
MPLQELLSKDIPKPKQKGYPFGSERAFHNLDSMKTYQVRWSHPKSVDVWIRNMIIGSSLNVCKGRSNLGDVTIDVIRSLNPKIMANLYNLPFADKSFDTVICDPPFDYYNTAVMRNQNQSKWIQELRRVARKRLILATTLRCIRVGPNWHVEFFVNRHKATLTMKFWQIFTFQAQELNQSRQAKLG